MTTLIIVESPKKAKTINGFIGPGYTAVASRGHIRDLPVDAMGIVPGSYELQYEVPVSNREHVDRLRAAVRGASRVLLATDPDREGEAIAWHLAEELKLQPGTYQRITYNAVEKSELEKAIASPRAIDHRLVKAQEGRRALDRLCGYRVSGPLSELISSRASAGRVQSPAIAILVKREREIQAFTPTVHFGIELGFEGGWSAEWDTSTHLAAGSEYIQDKDLALKIAAVQSLVVEDFTDSQTRKGPPAPFTTSTMQQAASNKLKMKVKATMDAAQSMVDRGYITYHRTDSPNVVDVTYERMVAFYAAAGIPMVADRRVWKAKESAQEAHDPCVPTDFNVREAGDNPEERALYRLIWQRAVASQMPDAVYATRRAVLVGSVDGQLVRFVARGSTLTEAGWRAVYEEQDDDEKERDNNPVPLLAVDATVPVAAPKVLQRKTKAPKRFKEADLVRELEDQGIGRPSTYAAIITTITERGYSAEDPKGFLHPTPLAFSIYDALVNRFSFIELDYTRRMEADLDRIARGETDYLTVVANADSHLSRELQAIEDAAPVHPCPSCGARLRRRMSKASAGQPSRPFWACSGYPGCTCTMPDVNGAPVARQQAVVLPGDGNVYPCPKCANPLQLRASAAGAQFFACTAYPKCKHSEPNAGGKPLSAHACPTCGQGLRHVFKPGSFDFVVCTSYPVCPTRMSRGADGAPRMAQPAQEQGRAGA